MSGVKNSSSVDCRSQVVAVDITGPNGKYHRLSSVRTVRPLGLTKQSLQEHDVRMINDLNSTVEIDVYKEVTPKILIGQDHWELIISQEVIPTKATHLVVSRTELGWVIHGRSSSKKNKLTRDPVNFCVNVDGKSELTQLLELVKYSFLLDALGVSNRQKLCAKSQRAERVLDETTKRTRGGWETGLLWASDSTALPRSKHIARNRLYSLEKKLDDDQSYARLYHGEIERLIQNGYAVKIANQNDDVGREWYLPHFGVRHPNKPGKIRIVFDAASKCNGTCLNDNLLSGPDLLNSLLGVLLRFRRARVAFTSDIQDMFLRVNVREPDQRFQRFLYRGKDRQNAPDVYCLRTLVFGVRSSPCSAIHVLNRNAVESGAQMPESAKSIRDNFYMDDYLDCAMTEEEAINRIKQVIQINEGGGFKMHKWTSNRESVLQAVPQVDRHQGSVDIDSNASFNAHTKTLGLIWNPREDTLGFKVSFQRVPREITSKVKAPTKRQALSVVMSVYDPIGFLAPFTVRGRIILQDVWKSAVGWDDRLKDSEFMKWRRWVEDLPKIGDIKVPRLYKLPGKPIRNELHAFCDASQQAYAAVVYNKVEYENGIVDVAFVAGKSRVAPIKPTTIPRLELQAALMAARLVRSIQTEMSEIKFNLRVYYSDSQTVINWIKGEPRNFRPYVAFRLGEIEELTEASEWKWVRSEDNPADDATRDSSTYLSINSRWLKGPNILYQMSDRRELDNLPVEASSSEVQETPDIFSINHICQSLGGSALPNIDRFSSRIRLLRATARVLQFVEICRRHQNPGQPLSADMIRQAEIMWIRQCQEEAFGAEINSLKRGKPVRKDSKIIKFTPRLGEEGLLRAEGRIDAVSGVPNDTRNPIILCGSHPFVRLMLNEYHIRFHHGFHNIVLNEIRQKFCVTKLRATLKSVCNSCQLCRLRRDMPRPPRLGNLPIARLAHHHKPFSFCGIDYFGPMVVAIGRRHEKRWGVLFTCLTTRAIHIELAASLSADSTIMALRRMTARRGQPTEIHSDNGTNLRGAEAELRAAVHSLDTAKLTDHATNNAIVWKFIPPGAPHMGGSWERLIQSVKRALKATLHLQAPKEEILLTMLAEAEYTLNCRPLTYVSLEPDEPEALTPNHFLLGSSSGNPSLGRYEQIAVCSRRQWQHSQTLADAFWKRWIREYLPTLVPRNTWQQDTRNFKLNDVVLLVDPQLPRNTWLKGIVEEVISGKDGRVRAAKIRTTRGIYTRPCTKLVLLVDGGPEIRAGEASPALRVEDVKERNR